MVTSGNNLKVTQILEIASVKSLLLLFEKGEVRYSELLSLIKSRATLGVSLRDLEQEGLIQRRVVDSKPIKSFYSLTEKGADVAKALQQVNILMNNEKHSKK